MKFSIPNQLENLANQDSEIINVDVLTNHMELSNHSDNVSDTGSVVNCYPDRQKSVCMKTKLSPATETHPQNNHAFNTGEEPLMITNCCYGGARPKVPMHTSYPTSQTVSDDTSVVGVTLSSNVMNSSKLYSTMENSAKSVSSQSESSAKTKAADVKPLNKSDSAIVGDYFFTNGAFNHSDITEETSSKSSVESVQGKPVQSFVDKFVRPDHEDDIPRWADPACQGIKYADDDEQSSREVVFEGNIVFDSSQVVTPTSDNQKRLYLEPGSEPESKSRDSSEPENFSNAKIVTRKISSDLKKSKRKASEGTCNNGFKEDIDDKVEVTRKSVNDDLKDTTMLINKHNTALLSDFERLDITQTSSLPNSPLHRLHKPDSPTKKLRDEVINGKCRHHSPLFKRKSKFSQSIDTSEDDDISSVEEIKLPSNYKNLESFQKAQLKQKV